MRLTRWRCSWWPSICESLCFRIGSLGLNLKGEFRSLRVVQRASLALLTREPRDRMSSFSARPAAATLVPGFGGLGLAVVVATKVGMTVRPLSWTVERHERQLCDRLARPKHDRDASEVGDLECEGALEPGIHEPSRRMHDQPQPAERAVVRRDERTRHQIDAVGGGDLDAADGHAFDGP